MAGIVTLTGVTGRVEWGYFAAAVIEGYTVTRQETRWSLRATLVSHDPYRLSCRPLVFVAPYTTHAGDRGEWRWPIRSYSIVDGRLAAELGPVT